MSRGCVALLVVVVVGLCLAPAPTKAGFDLSSILSSVAGDAVNRLYVDREITLMDRYCVMSRRPHFYRWELKWRSTVTCPGWTPIKGKASGYSSPTTSEREATKDFVTQAVARGLIQEEDATEWL